MRSTATAFAKLPSEERWLNPLAVLLRFTHSSDYLTDEGRERARAADVAIVDYWRPLLGFPEETLALQRAKEAAAAGRRKSARVVEQFPDLLR